jgi:hypothetical protein
MGSDKSKSSGSTFAATQSETSTESTISAPVLPSCLDVNEVQRLVAAAFDGDSVSKKRSAEATECDYSIGSGSSLYITAYAYSQNEVMSIGIYNTDRKYGGTSPAEVYSTALNALTDVSGQAPYDDSVEAHPEIGAGLVISGADGVLAGSGDYWYNFGFGGVKSNTAKYGPVITEIGKALADAPG